MSRPILFAAIVVALLPGVLLAEETTVYKSKNADGTSVYTQVEVQGSEARGVAGRDPTQAQAAEEAPKTDSQIACERAQENLVLYNSGDRLQRDKDGDGTPEPLTPEEIATERDLAERQVAAYCAKPEA
jgi:hypothetical protein